MRSVRIGSVVLLALLLAGCGERNLDTDTCSGRPTDPNRYFSCRGSGGELVRNKYTHEPDWRGVRRHPRPECPSDD